MVFIIYIAHDTKCMLDLEAPEDVEVISTTQDSIEVRKFQNNGLLG